MDSFFTLHSFLEVGKTQDLPSKFWQTLGDALRSPLLPHQLTHIIHTALCAMRPLASASIANAAAASLDRSDS
jgi:hypothetical protein